MKTKYQIPNKSEKKEDKADLARKNTLRLLDKKFIKRAILALFLHLFTPSTSYSQKIHRVFIMENSCMDSVRMKFTFSEPSTLIFANAQKELKRVSFKGTKFFMFQEVDRSPKVYFCETFNPNSLTLYFCNSKSEIKSIICEGSKLIPEIPML